MFESQAVVREYSGVLQGRDDLLQPALTRRAVAKDGMDLLAE
jgi:hypothetical protein